jgi:hypothetical protein
MITADNSGCCYAETFPVDSGFPGLHALLWATMEPQRLDMGQYNPSEIQKLFYKNTIYKVTRLQ